MGRFLEGAEPSHPLADRISFAGRRPSQCESTSRAHRIGQGHLSNHLACLKTSGLVQTQATRRLIYYSLADSRVPQLLALGESIFSGHGAGVATCAVVAPVQGQSGHYRAPQGSRPSKKPRIRRNPVSESRCFCATRRERLALAGA
jgi:ArsR family transcriptional regulator